MSANFVALRALLSDAGWSDASTDDTYRLTASAGRLGIIVNPKNVVLVFIDPNTLDPVNLTVTGGWSFGTIRRLAQHLEMLDSLTREVQ